MGSGLNYNDENILCDSVKWFTRKKHAFLSEYLKIWTGHVGNKNKRIPSLDIADLYASTGMCYCKDVNETWKGSALLAAECLELYKGGNRLFLNTYNPSEEDLIEQRKWLEINLSQFPRISKRTIITTLNVEEAVKEAKKKINPKYPSIWILDPYRAPDLPWEVVEDICTFEGSFVNKGGEVVIRRPELFINLMTSGMQRNVDISPKSISVALGMDEDVWRPQFEKLLKEGLNRREAIINLYTSQLSKYYEKPPIIIEVNDNSEKAIVYCLFLCTDSDAGHHVTKLLSLPNYEEWKVYQWRPEAKRIILFKQSQKSSKKISRDQRSLFDF